MGGEMDKLAAGPTHTADPPTDGAASEIPALARKIANGFNYPPDYSPWWFDLAEAGNLIKRITVAAD
jgi:hypothetical protein